MANRTLYNVAINNKITIPLGLYIIKNNKPYELQHNVINDAIYVFMNSDDMLEYKEHLDGVPLDKEEVSKLYPEYFI